MSSDVVFGITKETSHTSMQLVSAVDEHPPVVEQTSIAEQSPLDGQAGANIEPNAIHDSERPPLALHPGALAVLRSISHRQRKSDVHVHNQVSSLLIRSCLQPFKELFTFIINS